MNYQQLMRCPLGLCDRPYYTLKDITVNCNDPVPHAFNGYENELASCIDDNPVAASELDFTGFCLSQQSTSLSPNITASTPTEEFQDSRLEMSIEATTESPQKWEMFLLDGSTVKTMPECVAKAEAFKSVCDLRAMELRDDENNIVSYYHHCGENISQPSVMEKSHHIDQPAVQEDDHVIYIEDSEDSCEESPNVMETSIDEVGNHVVQHAVKEEADTIMIEDIEDSMEESKPKEPSNSGTVDPIYHPAFHFEENTCALLENFAKLTEASNNEETSSIIQPAIEADNNVFILEATEYIEQPSNASAENNIVQEVEVDEDDDVIFVHDTGNAEQPVNAGIENDIVQKLEVDEDDDVIFVQDIENAEQLSNAGIENYIVPKVEVKNDDEDDDMTPRSHIFVHDTEIAEQPSNAGAENDIFQEIEVDDDIIFVQNTEYTEQHSNAVKEAADTMVEDIENLLKKTSIPKDPSNIGTVDPIFHPAFHFEEGTYALLENFAKLTKASNNEEMSSIVQPAIEADDSVFILEDTEYIKQPSNADTKSDIVQEVEVDDDVIFVHDTEIVEHPANAGIENDIVQKLEVDEDDDVIFVHDTENAEQPSNAGIENYIVPKVEVEDDDVIFVHDTENAEQPANASIENDIIQKVEVEDNVIFVHNAGTENNIVQSAVNTVEYNDALWNNCLQTMGPSTDGETSYIIQPAIEADDGVFILEETEDTEDAENPSNTTIENYNIQPAVDFAEGTNVLWLNSSKITETSIGEISFSQRYTSRQTCEGIVIEYTDNFKNEAPTIKQEPISITTECVTPTVIEEDDDDDDVVFIEVVDNRIEESPIASAMLVNGIDPQNENRDCLRPIWDNISVPVLKPRPNKRGVGAARRKQKSELICQYVATNCEQMNELVCTSTKPAVIHFPPRQSTINTECVANTIKRAPATRKVRKPRAKKTNPTEQRKAYSRRTRQ